MRDKELVVSGVRLGEGDLVITRGHETSTGKADSMPLGERAQWMAAYSDELTVLVNILPDRALVDEGLAREVFSKVQQLCAVSGEFDYVAWLRTDSPEQLDQLLDQIGSVDGVEKTTTSIILSNKLDRGQPV